MKPTFSFNEAIGTGWRLFKKHWKFILPLGAITVFAQLFMEGMMQLSGRHSPILGLAIWMATVLVSIIITLGWSKVFLSLVRHGHAEWDTFKTEPAMWLHLIKVEIWYALYSLWYIFLSILPFAVLAAIGLVTHLIWFRIAAMIAAAVSAIVTAIYMRVRYQFVSYAVLDYSQYRSRAIFGKAGAIARASVVRLFLFDIVCGLLELLGLICIVLGLIIAIPVVKLAQAKVYDILKNRYEHDQHHAIEKTGN